MTPAHHTYHGRFAPSPTGPLHIGSLVAAVGSHLEARRQGGQWHIRMEDLDPPRVVPGAAAGILRTLERYGFEWDGEVVYQSQRGESYHAALETLRAQGLIYPCGCSRREILEHENPGSRSGVYPGTCRPGLAPGKTARALRLIVPDAIIAFTDRLQGPNRQNLAREVGDIVLRRADGLYAYQLAVVVDDAAMGITDIVRGSDLLDSTPRQIHLQRLLGLPTPDYAHLPLWLTPEGQKLSKQTGAAPIDTQAPGAVLWQALAFLGQTPPTELRSADVREIWTWALPNWRLDRVPARPHFGQLPAWGSGPE